MPTPIERLLHRFDGHARELGVDGSDVFEQFVANRSEKRRSACVADDFRRKRPEIEPLALSARQAATLAQQKGTEEVVGNPGTETLATTPPSPSHRATAARRWSIRAWWRSNRCRSGVRRSRRCVRAVAAGREMSPGRGECRYARIRPHAAAAAAQAALIRLCSPGTDSAADRIVVDTPCAESAHGVRRCRPRTSGSHDATSASNVLRTAKSSRRLPGENPLLGRHVVGKAPMPIEMVRRAAGHHGHMYPAHAVCRCLTRSVRSTRT